MKMKKPERRRILFSLLRMLFPSELLNYKLFFFLDGGCNSYQIPTNYLRKSQHNLIYHWSPLLERKGKLKVTIATFPKRGMWRTAFPPNLWFFLNGQAYWMKSKLNLASFLVTNKGWRCSATSKAGKLHNLNP